MNTPTGNPKDAPDAETQRELTPFATTRLASDEVEFSAARAADPLAFLDDASLAHCRDALELALKIATDLEGYTSGENLYQYDLQRLDEENLRVFTEILGEGEVAVLVHAPTEAQISESVMAGVWRVREFGLNGAVIRDYVEIGDMPILVRQAVETRTAQRFRPEKPPEGAMNVMPVLSEISARCARYEPGDQNYVISFSLLPMTEIDQQHLQATLGSGPVHINSRGYGRCRILATGVRNVWSVQYFSASNEVILDTIEIGDVPEAACAAKEDLEDSAVRLREIAEAYL